MSAHRMAAQHGRRRRLAAGLAIGAAAAALVPAAADAAGLVAAYDRYVPGKGFEIGLVNVGTGATVPVPAGVNTTADELHPALSPDGRYMLFMRTTLTPKLNGDIVPPADRSLLLVDRQTGGGLTALQGRGAGPVFTRISSSVVLSWGVPPTPFEGRFLVSRRASFSNGALGGLSNDAAYAAAAPSGQVLEIPHAATTTVLDVNTNAACALSVPRLHRREHGSASDRPGPPHDAALQQHEQRPPGQRGQRELVRLRRRAGEPSGSPQPRQLRGPRPCQRQ